MRIRHHLPGITTSPWIANNPIQPAGTEGLEAFHSSLWSHPSLLRVGGGFPKIVSADAPRSAENELHLVTLIGAQKAPALPALRPGERVFIDGLSQEALSPTSASFPRHVSITSLKERLETPAGEFLIPENLPLGVWTEVPEGWSGMGDRDGTAFYLFSGDVFLSPVNSAHVDFLLRRDKGRTAWNWRYYLAAALGRWLGLPEEHFAVEPGRERDLRDAFSAFGFHRWVVLKTAEKLGVSAELSSAEAAVLEAAEDFHGQRWEHAERLLRAGFDGLKGHLDALTGTTRRYFAEAHHGGMLHEDIGFYEHDWPQMVCDTLRGFMACDGVTASLDMPANVFRHYHERFPTFFRELRLWMEQGRIELVNGMFGQPLSDSHTLENLLSQLIEGRRELRAMFGMEPDVFAMEEYSLGPAMPQILEAAGIRQAVHAVRLGGTSKANSPGKRLWRGIGNGSVESIEHPDVGHPGLSTTYFLQLPDALAQSGRQGRKALHLFNLPDFGWNVLFRDEVFAGLKYGPVLFEMVTFQKLFCLLPKKADEVQGRWEDTYHTIFNQYTVRGNMRRYFERLRNFETLLVAAEIGAGFAENSGRPFAGAWRDYLLGSSHDYSTVGGGLNGWYGTVTNATYRGPVQMTFERTLEKVMSAKLDVWEGRLSASLAEAPDGEFLTNLHGFPVPLDGDGGGVLGPFASVPISSASKKVQASAERFPDRAGGTQAPHFAGDFAVLENDNTRFRISRETGAIESVLWEGRTLWKDNQLGIRLADNRIRMTHGALSGPVKSGQGLSIVHHGRIADHKDGTIGWLETTYHLQGGHGDLVVEMVLCPAILPPRGDFDWQKEWAGTFRYALPRAGSSPEVQVCQGNAILRVLPGKRDPGASGLAIPDALAHVTSPEALGYEASEGCPVWFFNAGFPSYLVYEDRIEQFLRMPGEEHLRLRFGIGFGENRYSAVQRSRMMFYPPLRTCKSMPSLPLKWENARIGLLRAEPEEGGFGLWFWNYGERPEVFAPEIAPGWRDAGISSARGNLSPNPAGSGWLAEPSSLIHLQLLRVKTARKPLPEPAEEPEACMLA